MGPRQLRSFIAVAEELHFGRAAKLVNLSQPALSLQISGIEDELQVKLFARNRRKTELTQAGEVFLQEARDVLQRTEQAITTVRRAALGQVGTLRIGFISTAAAVITPPLVKQFRERYAHVELDLRNVLTRDQLTQLQDRKLDVGFLRVPLQTPPEIKTRIVHREPFVLLMPASHPLASRKDLKLSDCQHVDFVMYSRKMAPGFHDLIMSMLHRNGLTPHVVQEAAEMYTLISLVAAGLGFAVAPASIALRHADSVVIRELPDEEVRSEIAIAWNVNHVSMTTQLFLQMVFETSRARKMAKARRSALAAEPVA
jgi:DNA-binding transcriptional LysR family regulator